MKKTFIGLMATVMFAATMISCGEDLNKVENRVHTEEEIPTVNSSLVYGDYTLIEPGIVSRPWKDTVSGETGFDRVPANLLVANGNYIKVVGNDTTPLNTIAGAIQVGDGVLDDTINFVYSHQITDPVEVHLVVSQIVMRRDLDGRTYPDTIVSYPGEAVKVIVTLEKSGVNGATGWNEYNVLNYQLVAVADPTRVGDVDHSVAALVQHTIDTVVNDSTVVTPDDPTIVGVTGNCTHTRWGVWMPVTGGIQIDGDNTVVETTNYSDGTSAVTGTSSYACHSKYTFTARPMVYDHNIDGTYNVTGNSIAGLGITFTHSHSHDHPTVNGHDYSDVAPDCDMEIYQAVAVGNIVTLKGRSMVNGSYVYKDYSYQVTINTPTTPDTVRLDGQMAYYFESDAYFTSYTNYVRRYGFIVMTDGRVYKTLRKISPLSNVAGGNWYTPSFTLYGQTMSSSEMAALPSQVNAGNALALWFEHSTDDGNPNNDNSVSDGTHTSSLSIVSYNGEIHYWHVVSTSAMNSANWYGDITLVGTTFSGNTLPNPVHTASACTSVTINGVVYTGTLN